MDNWMYHKYWKIAGIIIFVYVLIGGMTSPLNPGLTKVSPNSVIAGQPVSVRCRGYNTNFTSGGSTSAWLKMDSVHLIKAVAVRPIDENTTELDFKIPEYFPVNSQSTYLTLITYNGVDGPAVMPSAIYVSKIKRGDDDEWLDRIDISINTPAEIRFPYRSILEETIRNPFFHIALWMSMIVLLLVGLYHAIKYLATKDMRHDKMSSSFNQTAIVYGLLGLATGSIWARYTWGTWWTSDVKLNMAAITMLIYLAYFVLRSSTIDFEKRARISAVYSIFSFALLLPLIFVIPRLTDSLHPGNGGNPALGGEDLDNTLRLFFYPSIIALIMIGTWISTLVYRAHVLQDRILSN